MTLRAMIGNSAFQSEKQSDPVDPAACEFPSEYFDWNGVMFDDWPAEKEIQVKTMALDPSLGRDSKKGDYSAIITFARTRHGVEYVDADLARRPVTVRCHDLVEAAKAFRPDGIGVETVLFQELILVPLQQAAQQIQYDAPVYRIDQGSVPKEVRIRRLTVPLAQRRMRFRSRSPGAAMLLQQLRDWPTGFQDGPDALEFCRRLAIDLMSGKAIRRKADRPS